MGLPHPPSPPAPTQAPTQAPAQGPPTKPPPPSSSALAPAGGALPGVPMPTWPGTEAAPQTHNTFPDTQKGQFAALNHVVKYLRWRCTEGGEGELCGWVPLTGFSVPREMFIPKWVQSDEDKRYGTWDHDPANLILVEWPRVWSFVWKKLLQRTFDLGALAPAGEDWLQSIGPEGPDAPCAFFVRPVPGIPAPHETLKGCHWEANFAWHDTDGMKPEIHHGLIGVCGRGGSDTKHHAGPYPPGPGFGARPRPAPAPPAGPALRPRASPSRLRGTGGLGGPSGSGRPGGPG
jgi:hypothetical protein